MASRIVHSTPAQVDQRKRDIEARCVKAKVVGALPIRDAVTREDVLTGDIVRLDPADPNRPGGTLISALVESGCIELLTQDASEA